VLTNAARSPATRPSNSTCPPSVDSATASSTPMKPAPLSQRSLLANGRSGRPPSTPACAWANCKPSTGTTSTSNRT
jgi:hypothetical protein